MHVYWINILQPFRLSLHSHWILPLLENFLRTPVKIYTLNKYDGLLLSGRFVRWSRRLLPLMSHSEYADGTDKQTDGRTPDRYITLSARRGQRNEKRELAPTTNRNRWTAATYWDVVASHGKMMGVSNAVERKATVFINFGRIAQWCSGVASSPSPNASSSSGSSIYRHSSLAKFALISRRIGHHWQFVAHPWK